MRQKIKPGSQKERLRQKNQKKRNDEPRIGKCSSCGDKPVTIARFRGSQLCINKCLKRAIVRLGGVVPTAPADQTIAVGEPFAPETMFTGKIKDGEQA